MIEQYLNIRHSLRNLTDEDFENALAQLAIELQIRTRMYVGVICCYTIAMCTCT